MDYNIMNHDSLRRLYKIGAVASMLQLSTIVLSIVVTMIYGSRVISAEEFFVYQQSHYWSSLLRLDLMMLILVGLYLGNFPALFFALWRIKPITTIFAFLFTMLAVALSFAGESTFSLRYLGEMYATAASELERSQIIVSGEAILASGWWNSTGSYITGILLQGGGVMISIAMLYSTDFSKITGIAGIVGNGFDLLQHLLSPFAPQFSEYLSFAMVAYLIWYPMLSRDLFRLSKNQSTS
jgi:hypothetical protein